ncbi:MAG TPA: tRNA (5-methylaminomethyl-2-thiouridine)(34)-methyltransferase MnmD [Caulobacteraceae bacterium]|nr:tRNA (5-methylaminomethyl-2-thiouridine)(34)-methyltransferase MnmD [Caulobacteraceae bacterium]
MTWSPPPSPIEWPHAGPPRSRLYDDVYFSAGGGLAEAREVFLAGCGLPERWRSARRFTVGELGFGIGRNLLALLELWRSTAPAGGFLHVFSLEAHPLAAAEAARALAALGGPQDLARLIAARWPGRARGFHRVDFPEVSSTLDVAIGDAAEALGAWDGRADAWFLDGFSPAKNPAMWTGELMGLVARRSNPGATAATYAAAGAVRRALGDAGFGVERRAGALGKRHRLRAALPGLPPPKDARRVAVIGGGIAGASLARALAAMGTEARVFDAGDGPAPPPAVLVAPRLDAGLGAQAALFAQSARRALTLYEAADAVTGRSLLQLAAGPKDPRRFAAIARSDLFEPEAMRLISAAEAHTSLNESAGAALLIGDAGTVAPAAVLSAWTQNRYRVRVRRLAREGALWRGLDEAGEPLFEADAVCIAAGVGSTAFAPDLPLLPVRGQASFAPGASTWAAAAFGAWVLPTPAGVLFGATHDRGDTGLDVRDSDHQRNLAAVAAAQPRLAERLRASRLQGWAGVRAATPDYLPIAGALGDGLFCLTGLGSRGYTLAPLLAEHLAALIADAPSPLPRVAAALISPARFAERAARKRGSCNRSTSIDNLR